MNHEARLLTCFLIITSLVVVKTENDTSNVVESLNINDIADALILTLGVRTDSNETKVNELKEKLKKVNSYAIDKQKYALLLTNVTMETDLNETEFYKALNDEDEFKFLKDKESKNIFLQMKERMNRDDILNMLSEKDHSKLVKSARKVNDFDYFDKNKDQLLDTVVDKIIAETPHDNHTFSDDKRNGSEYWDPQRELEDLGDHHKHDGRRIFKGERTTVRYYPFMVSVHVMGRFWCGGVLYYHDLVLTSAACLQLMHNNRFFRENPRVLQIRIASNHSRIGGEVIDAMEVYFHPSYNPRTLRNNIAVIRLSRHIIFTYHRAPKIIPISHNTGHLPATAEVLVLGWGVKKTSQKLSYEPVYLQRKFLPVYPNTFCKEVYGEKFITKEMFCAGTFTTGEGACDHDAGGPAVLAGRLVGIISFGPAVCGFPNAPTVFTNVGAYADWIETVNETMPSYYRARVRTTSSTVRPLLQYLLTQMSVGETQADERDKAFSMPTTRTPAMTVTITAASTTPSALRLQYASSEDSWGDK